MGKVNYEEPNFSCPSIQGKRDQEGPGAMEIDKRSSNISREIPQRYKDGGNILMLFLLKSEILIIARLFVLLANFQTYLSTVIDYFIKNVFYAL